MAATHAHVVGQGGRSPSSELRPLEARGRAGGGGRRSRQCAPCRPTTHHAPALRPSEPGPHSKHKHTPLLLHSPANRLL
ncbi:hypothetical protein JYU34_003435 [Plutella xylostella]|uniref:Uncharacterized protein n=1 Tax=Plutella xylostella TaxID=51655 RepID=A0ABQ7R017_PLUXY|nr:hypothetical protein JYU34_003435 [Plutella xylostella]